MRHGAGPHREADTGGQGPPHGPLRRHPTSPPEAPQNKSRRLWGGLPFRLKATVLWAFLEGLPERGLPRRLFILAPCLSGRVLLLSVPFHQTRGHAGWEKSRAGRQENRPPGRRGRSGLDSPGLPGVVSQPLRLHGCHFPSGAGFPLPRASRRVSFNPGLLSSQLQG